MCERVSPGADAARSSLSPHYRNTHTIIQCGPLLQEYTMIHQSPLITDRFIHSCPKHCIMHCIMYIGPPTGGKQEGESIITQLRGGALETKSADIGEISQP